MEWRLIDYTFWSRPQRVSKQHMRHKMDGETILDMRATFVQTGDYILESKCFIESLKGFSRRYHT